MEAFHVKRVIVFLFGLNCNSDVVYHTLRHRRNVLSGMYKDRIITLKMVHQEEWSTYLYTYKNQGLYRNYGYESKTREMIDHHGHFGEIYSDPGIINSNYPNQWWHFIYRIPRLW